MVCKALTLSSRSKSATNAFASDTLPAAPPFASSSTSQNRHSLHGIAASVGCSFSRRSSSFTRIAKGLARYSRMDAFGSGVADGGDCGQADRGKQRTAQAANKDGFMDAGSIRIRQNGEARPPSRCPLEVPESTYAGSQRGNRARSGRVPAWFDPALG